MSFNNLLANYVAKKKQPGAGLAKKEEYEHPLCTKLTEIWYALHIMTNQCLSEFHRIVFMKSEFCTAARLRLKKN